MSESREQIFYGARTVGSDRSQKGNKYNTRVLKTIPANQVGGGEGNRYYVGEGSSYDMGVSHSFADMEALKNMLSHSDSTSYKNAITQFPDLSSHWAKNDTHRAEFIKQWGYDPKDMPKDADGYNLYHDEMLELLEKAKKKEFNLLDFLKIGGGKR